MITNNFFRAYASRLLACTALTGAMALAATAQAAPVKLTAVEGDASIEGDLVSYEDGIYVVNTVIGEISVPDGGVTCEGDGCAVAVAVPEPEPAPEIAGASNPDGILGETVALTSNNGSVRIEGTLLAFQDNTYRIETVIGTFDVDGSDKSCEGPGCPGAASVQQAAVSTRLPTIGGAEDNAEADISTAIDAAVVVPEPEPEPVRVLPQIQLASIASGTPEVRIAGPASVIDGLLPALADIYAADTGAQSKLADVLLVEAGTAASEGFPAGKLAALVGNDTSSQLAVVGQLTANADDAISSLNDASADIALSTLPAPMLVVRNRTEAVLGNEAIVAVVSPANGVFQLTPREIAEILAGTITNWSEVGGEDRAIRVFGLPDSHELSTARDQMFLSPFRLEARAADVTYAVESDLIAALAAEPGAFGLVSHDETATAKALSVGSTCGITTAATPENIRTARYPFSRALVALSFAAEGPAAEIINAVENADDELILAAGLEPITLARFAMDEDAENLRNALPGIDDRFQRLNAATALRILPTSERLGTMLTYDRSSNRLDTRSKAELDRILEFVAENDIKELIVAGHVESSADARADKSTARGLAAGARREMEAADTAGALDDVVIRAVGVGSVLPLACDVVAGQDTLNRRVEVWIRR